MWGVRTGMSVAHGCGVRYVTACRGAGFQEHTCGCGPLYVGIGYRTAVRVSRPPCARASAVRARAPAGRRRRRRPQGAVSQAAGRGSATRCWRVVGCRRRGRCRHRAARPWGDAARVGTARSVADAEAGRLLIYARRALQNAHQLSTGCEVFTAYMVALWTAVNFESRVAAFISACISWGKRTCGLSRRQRSSAAAAWLSTSSSSGRRKRPRVRSCTRRPLGKTFCAQATGM